MLQRRVVAWSALALAFGACQDEVLAPQVDEEEALALPPGVHAYVTLSDRAAPVGGTVVVTANVQVVEVPVTIAGYTLTLRYDPERLEPVEARRAAFEGMQVVNLRAADGVRAAGAATEGIQNRVAVLAAVTFKVKAPAYTEGLNLSLDDLTALESFEQIGAQVRSLSRTVLTARYLATN